MFAIQQSSFLIFIFWNELYNVLLSYVFILGTFKNILADIPLPGIPRTANLSQSESA